MWDKVKEFIGGAAPVVGSLLGGPAGGATGSLIASWLGVEDSPEKVLEKLQTDPKAMVELKRMESEERKQLRELEHQAAMAKLKDRQHQHEQQQETIRSGDNAEDEYVRRTRPKIARRAFYFGFAYIALFELLAVFDKGDGASWEIAGMFLAPTLAYMGFRTLDGFGNKFKFLGKKNGSV
ncbi:hypothetical protein DFO83_101300 [Idiomarina loihiensis]|uniref:Holin (3TMs family) n=1 Tax=Idiomarina aquatica TaxID=1327752 RepID=A0AA94JDT2_9GAMM|nr:MULTISPECIES: hypothetical protein [Idiomarina]PWW41608.1 hypothetical protein DFO83_101300 [Idiomarina loihiensis]RUO44958.1 hypothetical protein CWE23_02720 [Idiomarina aquatica]TDP50666.1 hypothetical protein DET58_101300 [Idiomarina loihiensis]TDS25056.1 hypothetical protein DET62_101139 [Idiomarina sp. H2]